ncbi:MAG: flagellar basal body P-ring formation protein FlgA [Desulfobulbaceae bacterium]|nr:flagellar basal body P-ring formation protein FlgA [Desulfobulbaceae bacterium]
MSFQANASVTAAKIVLADIAVIKPTGSAADAIGQLPVAAAPAPGKTKQLSTVSVITSLRNRPEVADVDWQGSQSIVVERKGNQISQEQMQQIVTDYLLENSAKLQAQVEFTAVRSPQQLVLPAGQLSWKVTPSNPNIIGSSSFSIFFTVDGKPAGNCVVRGRLNTFSDILTAVKTLHKGDVIKEEHLALQRQNLAGFEDPFQDQELIIGMQVARTVNAGKPLTQKDIVSPPIIKDGEMIKIFARKGTLLLSTSGIAQSDGRLGETIKVKNISSNKLIHCRVDGPGIVSVDF